MLLNRQSSLPNLHVSKHDQTTHKNQCCNVAPDSPYTPAVNLGEFFELIMKDFHSEKGGCVSSKEATADHSGNDSDNTLAKNTDLQLRDVISSVDYNSKEGYNVYEDSSSRYSATSSKPEGEIIEVIKMPCSDHHNLAMGLHNRFEDRSIGNANSDDEFISEGVSKNYKRRKSRVQGAKKKWKVFELSLGFEFSLLPRRVPVTDCDHLDDVEKELETFEKDCTHSEEGNVIESIDQSSSCRATPAGDNKEKSDESENVTDRVGGEVLVCCHDNANVDTKVVAAVAVTAKTTLASSKKCRDIYSSHEEVLFESKYFDWVWFYESKVNAHELEALVTVQEDKRISHLRNKRKWKVQKAHKQIKSKYCATVQNGGHGKKLYLKHIVVAAMKLGLGYLFRRTRALSMKRIDKEKGYAMGTIKENRNSKAAAWSPSTPAAVNKVSNKNHHKVVGHTLDAYNFDGDFSADLVNVLQTAQYRDLTPEDYELLLRLDDRVKTKTVDNSVLDRLKTDTATEDTAGDICMVCLDPYIVGELRKFLPCDHVFHAQCIDMWLKNSSVSCPLDGREVMPS